MKFGVLDIESTGLDVEKDRIIEMAVNKHDLDDKNGKRYSHHMYYSNDGVPINPKAQLIHGITPSILVGKEPFRDYAKAWLMVIEGCDYLIAHNGKGFDFLILYHEFKRAGLEFPTNVKLIDTMEWTWATSMGKKPSLNELCYALDVDYDPDKAHSAQYDTDCLSQCVLKYLEMGNSLE